MQWRLRLGRLPGPLRRRRFRPLVRRFSKTFSAFERRLITRNRRTIGGWVAGGVPVLLLTTIGRRTGKARTTPLLFHREHDGSVLVIAVNGTADWNPDWFHNLVANQQGEVEIDGVRQPVEAVVLDDAERAAAWDEACRAFPGLEPAQASCRRPIPVIRLTPPNET